MLFYYIAPFVPVIIAIVLFTRWCRKENNRVIDSVNDAFDKAIPGRDPIEKTDNICIPKANTIMKQKR
jgi:hypothetical protein